MHLFIKYKLYLFLSVTAGAIALLVYSCKKDNSDTVSYFLTSGTWTLASVTRQTFVGDTLKKTDTLNTACSNTQVFTFKNDNSCTYTNYHCITQTSNGKWQLANDNLSLQTTLTAQDTLNGVVVTKPAAVFDIGQIINLGQYSFVIQTGNISSYYTSKTKRVITRYGFIHATN